MVRLTAQSRHPRLGKTNIPTILKVTITGRSTAAQLYCLLRNPCLKDPLGFSPVCGVTRGIVRPHISHRLGDVLKRLPKSNKWCMTAIIFIDVITAIWEKEKHLLFYSLLLFISPPLLLLSRFGDLSNYWQIFQSILKSFYFIISMISLRATGKKLCRFLNNNDLERKNYL